MAYAMTKQGSLDNCVTYEFMCDTVADMNAIENRYRTIGTIAIVLQGESGGLDVYIAGSDKQWNALSSIGASGGASGAGLTIHICAQNEVSNGLPDIASPNSATIYLVPAGQTSGNLYEEYIYVNNAWEKFGGGSVDLNGYAPIANPVFTGSISLGRSADTTVGENSVAEGSETTASEQNAHAEGASTTASGYNSHAEGATTLAAGDQSHAEGAGTTASGGNSHAEGAGTTASAAQSHAEGGGTTASGQNSHAEGNQTLASGAASHAEGTGNQTTKITYSFYNASIQMDNEYRGRKTVGSTTQAMPGALSPSTHSEGHCTVASGAGGEHAEGQYTFATGGGGAHAEGKYTYAEGAGAAHAEGQYTYAGGAGGEHAEGQYTYASGGGGAHAEGQYTCATGSGGNHAEGYCTVVSALQGAHAEGYYTNAMYGYANHAEGYGYGSFSEGGTTKYYGAYGTGDHSEGYKTYADSGVTGASGGGAHAEGNQTKAKAQSAHAEGDRTVASANGSHSEGSVTTASGQASHAEGGGTTASGSSSHAEGNGTTSSGSYAHAEGNNNIASGESTHAEGAGNTASGINAHAEGGSNVASGHQSHAEGGCTIAAGLNSHSGGTFNVADNYDSWPEWAANTSYEVGDKVKRTTTSNNVTTVDGYVCKTANSDSSFTSSKWNNLNGMMNYAEIIGNGTAENSRSNARALDWNGNEYLMGDVYVGCNANSTGGTKLARIPAPPSANGTYILQAVVNNGVITYSWVTNYISTN